MPLVALCSISTRSCVQHKRSSPRHRPLDDVNTVMKNQRMCQILVAYPPTPYPKPRYAVALCERPSRALWHSTALASSNPTYIRIRCKVQKNMILAHHTTPDRRRRSRIYAQSNMMNRDINGGSTKCQRIGFSSSDQHR